MSEPALNNVQNAIRVKRKFVSKVFLAEDREKEEQNSEGRVPIYLKNRLQG
jgi:hypothetical protein